eukprot:COSAG01_NODE_31981_length_588_cov_1.016360_1_plen_195_part_11
MIIAAKIVYFLSTPPSKLSISCLVLPRYRSGKFSENFLDPDRLVRIPCADRWSSQPCCCSWPSAGGGSRSVYHPCVHCVLLPPCCWRRGALSPRSALNSRLGRPSCLTPLAATARRRSRHSVYARQDHLSLSFRWAGTHRCISWETRHGRSSVAVAPGRAPIGGLRHQLLPTFLARWWLLLLRKSWLATERSEEP